MRTKLHYGERIKVNIAKYLIFDHVRRGFVEKL